MLVWRKLSSVKWEEIWFERLAQFGPRVSATALRGAKAIRIEVWELNEAEGKQLLKAFGGKLYTVNRNAILQKAHAHRAPIKIREHLVVVANEADREPLQAREPKRKVIAIPPALAFGTGDHATTATCLRLLCDVADELDPGKWEMLDLGTGTGLLAIGARCLGARSALAGDFDPEAVRVAKENIRINGLTRISVHKLDVLQWAPKRTYDVVAANIFSEILIRAARQISESVAPAGSLILSGILREHEGETLAAFKKCRKWQTKAVRKGKWVTLLLQAQLS